MTTEPHRVRVRLSRLAPGYWAECSCGWKGPARERSVYAEDDFAEHLRDEREAQMEATG